MDLWQLNLRHLGAAAAICHLGSVSAAAEAVSLTQPAITQALGKLETQFGLPLFERRPDGMEPTGAARLLTQRIDTALAHIASPRVTMAQLRALIAFADAGSYAGASIETGLAQPSLHRAVSDLSVALRRPMTERRGKGLALTDAGRRTVRNFRLARAELQAALAEVENLKGREVGRIAIGAMPLSRAKLLPAAVTAFHRAHPEIAISIAEGSWVELIEPLRDGDLDLLIGALRDPSPGDDVEQQPMFEDRLVILGRKAHPLSQSPSRLREGLGERSTNRLARSPMVRPSVLREGLGEGRTIGERANLLVDLSPQASPANGRGDMIEALARYPWTIAAKGVPLRAQWERIFTDAGVTVPDVPVECGSVITIRQILMDSDFLTLLSPDQVAVELEAGWLEIICDAPEGLTRTIGVTTRADWRPTKLQRAFVETLNSIGTQ